VSDNAFDRRPIDDPDEIDRQAIPVVVTRPNSVRHWRPAGVAAQVLPGASRSHRQ
jgi:hypothetical protein